MQQQSCFYHRCKTTMRSWKVGQRDVLSYYFRITVFTSFFLTKFSLLNSNCQFFLSWPVELIKLSALYISQAQNELDTRLLYIKLLYLNQFSKLTFQFLFFIAVQVAINLKKTKMLIRKINQRIVLLRKVDRCPLIL